MSYHNSYLKYNSVIPNSFILRYQLFIDKAKTSKTYSPRVSTGLSPKNVPWIMINAQPFVPLYSDTDLYF